MKLIVASNDSLAPPAQQQARQQAGPRWLAVPAGPHVEELVGLGYSVLILPEPEQGRIDPWALERAAEAEEIVVLLPRGRADLVRCHIWHLGPDRVLVGQLPDPIGAASVREAIRSAQKLQVGGVLTPTEALDRLRLYLESPAVRGIPTGWAALDERITIRPGNMYGLLGFPKVGKTTFSLVLGLSVARTRRVVWYVSFEERVEELMLRVAAHLLGRPRSAITSADCSEVMRRMDGVPFLLSGSGELPCDLGVLERTTRQVGRRYGLDLVIVDNLHFVVRRAEGSVEAIGVASRTLRQLAAELGCAVIVVLQPRKPERGYDGPPSAHDARWTGDVLADAHGLILVHRWERSGVVREDPLEPYLLVQISRVRDSAGGDFVMVMDASRCTIREASQGEVQEFLELRGGDT